VVDPTAYPSQSPGVRLSRIVVNRHVNADCQP
jgi:hypothetical protein